MKHFALLGLGIALLAACSKEDDVINCVPLPGPSSPTGTLADLRRASPGLQTFPFDLGQAQRLRTQRGATVEFGAGVFLLPNGTVATGQAELRLREIYEVPDMVLADLPTTTYLSFNNRRLLLSGGEFNLQVWQGSTRLRLATANVVPSGPPPRVVLTSPQPTASPDTAQMLLWNQPAIGRNGAPRDSTGWQPVLTPANSPTATPVQTPLTAGYYSAALPLDSIGYWNIDRIWPGYQTRPSGHINVEVPAATGTRVYFRPVGLNGLGGTVLAYPSLTRWYGTLPYGVDVVVVVVQERAGHLYFGTQRVTTTAGLVVTPTLEALSVAEIVRRIRLL